MSDQLLVATKNSTPTVAQFRHKAEVPMLALGIILTSIVSLAALYVLFSGWELTPFAQGVLFGLVAPVLAFFFIRYTFWNTAANSVEVTVKQFPEIYTIYHDLAEEMGFSANGKGINKMPRLYISNGNGTMNAFASKCQLKRGYVVLYSDIADLAYTHGEFDTIKFILAHELGHIKCGHVNLWRVLINPVTTALFLDKTVTRAQEYTADRVACYYASEGSLGMISLFAGKNLGHKVDIDEYFNSIANHKDGLWLRVSNFLSSHAVGFRRMKALQDAKTKGWNIHGKMLWPTVF